MAKEMTKQAGGAATDQLKKELRGLAGAVGERAVASVGDKVGDMAGRLTEYAENGGPGLKAALTGGRPPSAPALPASRRRSRTLSVPLEEAEAAGRPRSR